MNIIHRVRVLFMIVAVAMLLLYPLFADVIPESPLVTYAGILALVVLAALTTIRQRALLLVDAVIAAGGLIAFEFYAVEAFGAGLGWFGIVNQLLAVACLGAFYYAVIGKKLAHTVGEFDEA